MKKGIIILFSLLLLSSCFSSNDVNNTKNNNLKVEQIIEKKDSSTNKKNIKNEEIKELKKEKNNVKDQNNNKNKGTIKENKNIQNINKQNNDELNFKEEFYKNKVPNDYKIGADILLYKKIIDNDKTFSSSEDMKFSKVVRGYIFGDNIEGTLMNELVLCLNGEKEASSIKNDFPKNVCIGKNIYSKEIYNNFYHIKDTLIKYKKVKEGNSFDCSYFIKDNYKFDYEHIFKENSFYKNIGEVKNTIKLTDYVICKKFQDIKGYNLKKELYYYNLAINLKSCDYLNDKNLVGLCKKVVMGK